MCCVRFCCQKRTSMACVSSGKHKPSRTEKGKLDSFVSAMHKKGIKLLALDFDKTLIDIHTGGSWSQHMGALIPHVRQCMKDLLECAANKGIYIAIVTFNREPLLIRDLLTKLLSKKACSRLYIQASDAEYVNKSSDKNPGKSPNKSPSQASASASFRKLPIHTGKVPHIKLVLEMIKIQHDITVEKEQVLLMDDDLDNVQLSLNAGHLALQVHEDVDYNSFEVFKEKLLSGGP